MTFTPKDELLFLRLLMEGLVWRMCRIVAVIVWLCCTVAFLQQPPAAFHLPTLPKLYSIQEAGELRLHLLYVHFNLKIYKRHACEMVSAGL